MLVRRLARPMLASYFLAEGANLLRRPQEAAKEAAPFVEMASRQAGLPNDPELVARSSGAAQLLGGTLLATGRLPRAGAALLAGALAPSTYVHQAFWAESDPQAKARKKATFLRNVAMMGGVILAAVDTAGKPSLRWRAVRGAAGLSRSARREARLLRSQAQNALL